MSRSLSLCALMLVGPAVASAGEGEGVYMSTAHGDAVTGVNRTSGPVGACVQCHTAPDVTGSTFPLGLFTTNDNALCFDCHNGAGPQGIFQGPGAYLMTAHWTSGLMLWPGPLPPPRPAGSQGLCLNCHTPHGAQDALGLVPVLGYVREEALCLACHDANGPSVVNVAQQVNAPGLARHPVVTVAGAHAADEGLSPAAFGALNRHAECADCHNPHAARSSDVLGGVSRISVSNGAGGTVPAYTPRPADAGGVVFEFEVCFKCHSSWTNLPAGARDLATETNPNNASFHPVQGPGTNMTSQMAASLAGGLGTPHLTTGAIITCSDCHGGQALPTTVTTVSSYTGAVPTGPHGDGDAPTAAYSSAILRGRYRLNAGGQYSSTDYELCFTCHSPAPFNTSSTSSRADTRFRYHGRHVRDWGAGCNDCHNSLHGSAGAFYPSNRQYARLVAFSSIVQGRTSVEPTWSGSSCNLRCHGESHANLSY
ncbi:MAG: hypothetical protein KC933_22615 [Myxococcales bacterium]|nr:hypothetical protein [Myxococcales bacterium]